MSTHDDGRGARLGRLVRRPLGWLDNGLDWCEKAVLVAGILAMAAVSIANVASRNLLGSSLQYANDLTQILLVIVTFMGVGVAAREARHIRVSAVHDLLPKPVQKGLLAFIGLSTSAVLLLLAGYGWDYARSTQRSCRVLPDHLEAGPLAMPLGALPLPVGILLVIGAMILVGHAIRLVHAHGRVLLARLGPITQRLALTCAVVAGLLIAAWLFGLFIELVDNRSGRCRVMSSTGFPVYLVHMLVPLGLLLGAIQFALGGIRNLTSRDNYLSWYRRDEYDSAAQAVEQAGLSHDPASREGRNG